MNETSPNANVTQNPNIVLKPNGKPSFAKGNKLGKGLPFGYKTLTTQLREAIKKVSSDQETPYDVAIIKKVLQKASEGDPKMIELLWDRLEGKVVQQVAQLNVNVTPPLQDEQKEKLLSLLKTENE